MAAKSNLAVYKLRQKVAKVDPVLEDEFMSGRVLGKLTFAKILKIVCFEMMIISNLSDYRELMS